MKRLMGFLVLGLFGVREAAACTTFCLQSGDQKVFGKNYDWNVGDGLVFVNKRGVEKTSLDDGGPVHRWTSTYGSLTFNQFGREHPNGGMNEAGLVVELMWLNETKYPQPDARPEVGCLEWIQVQLDQYATVREVLAHIEDLRISESAPLHYLVCDVQGQCATIEFLEGKLVARTEKELPVAALANSTYADSMQSLNQHQGFGGRQPIPATRGSLDRFVRAADFVRGYDGKQPAVAHAFQTLQGVANGDYTKWSIVYDLPARTVHYRTLENPQIREIALADLDFACATPVRMLDIQTGGPGPVTSLLKDYQRQQNRDLIGRVFSRIDFLAGVPAAQLDAMAAHPDSMACQAESVRKAATPGPSGGQ